MTITEAYNKGYNDGLYDGYCTTSIERGLTKEKYDLPEEQEPCEDAVSRWIPVSERLPNDRDWYLGIFQEADTGWINPLPYICEYVGHETAGTTKGYWILRGFTDIDNPLDFYKNLECVAWTNLPEPYKEE